MRNGESAQQVKPNALSLNTGRIFADVLTVARDVRTETAGMHTCDPHATHQPTGTRTIKPSERARTRTPQPLPKIHQQSQKSK